MKFWKSLSNLIEKTLPDWRDKFLSYKDLKQQLKLIHPKDGDKPTAKRARLSGGEAPDDDDGADSFVPPVEAEVVAKEVSDFVMLLEAEIDKFNAFFVDKEEEYVIKWKVSLVFFSFFTFWKSWSWVLCFLVVGVNGCFEFVYSLVHLEDEIWVAGSNARN